MFSKQWLVTNLPNHNSLIHLGFEKHSLSYSALDITRAEDTFLFQVVHMLTVVLSSCIFALK